MHPSCFLGASRRNDFTIIAPKGSLLFDSVTGIISKQMIYGTNMKIALNNGLIVLNP